jgi:hypothetical protein
VVIVGGRPFQDVMDAIHAGISRPDIEGLFRQLAAATSFEQFSSLVAQAQGSAGLMRFLELELDNALALDPHVADKRPLNRSSVAWYRPVAERHQGHRRPPGREATLRLLSR